MSYLGSWKIDDLLTFPAITHRFDTGALTDADAVPAYRVYEDETGTAILTGNTAKLDDANTTGFYSEQLTLSAANGFEKGKCYTIYITAAVNSVTGGQHHTFQIEAEVDANTVSGTVATVTNLTNLPAITAGWITAAGIATGAVDADALATDAVAEITAAIIAKSIGDADGTLFGEFCRGVAAVLLGKASGMGGSSPTFRDIADGKNVVVVTGADADGNRPTVTLDLA